ncbi:suppressor of tub2 mutation, partial [Physocladia obscura]
MERFWPEQKILDSSKYRSEWRGRDQSTGAAVLMVVTDGNAPPGEVERARVEAEALRDFSASRPLSVQRFAAFYRNGEGAQVLVGEGLDADAATLAELLRVRRLSEQQAQIVAYHVLDALAAVHARYVVHGAVSPDAVVLVDGGRPKLARFADCAQTAADNSLTRSTNAAFFQAPEMRTGCGRDARPARRRRRRCRPVGRRARLCCRADSRRPTASDALALPWLARVNPNAKIVFSKPAAPAAANVASEPVPGYPSWLKLSPVNGCRIMPLLASFYKSRQNKQKPSNKQMDSEQEVFGQLTAAFSGAETEGNWQTRDALLRRLGADVPLNTWSATTVKAALGFAVAAAASLRTTLAMTAAAATARLLRRVFAGNNNNNNNNNNSNNSANASTAAAELDASLRALGLLCAAAKKLIASAGADAVFTIIEACPPSLLQRALTSFVQLAKDKNAQARAYALQFILRLVHLSVVPDAGFAFEKSSTLDILLKALQTSLSDANPAVRETSREVFDIVRVCWPSRAESLLSLLDASTKKAVLKQASKFQLPKSSEQISLTKTPSIDSRSSARSSPRKSIESAQLEEIAEISSEYDAVQQVINNLSAENETAVIEAIASLEVILKSKNLEPYSSALQAKLGDIIDPSTVLSPKVLEALLTTPSLTTIMIPNSLLEKTAVFTTLKSIILRQTPVPRLAQRLPQNIVEFFASNIPGNVSESIPFLIDALTAANIPTRPVRGIPAPPASWTSVQYFMLSLLSRSLASDPAAAVTVSKADRAIIRTMLVQAANALTTIMTLKAASSVSAVAVQNAKADALTVLGAAREVDEESFQRFLGTLEETVGDEIRRGLGLFDESAGVNGIFEGETTEKIDGGRDSGHYSSENNNLGQQQEKKVQFEEESTRSEGALSCLEERLEDESFIGMQLADITYEGGLVEESFMADEKNFIDDDDENDGQDSNNDGEDILNYTKTGAKSLFDEDIEMQETPKAATKTSYVTHLSPASGGMIGHFAASSPSPSPYTTLHQHNPNTPLSRIFDRESAAAQYQPQSPRTPSTPIGRRERRSTLVIASTPPLKPEQAEFNKWMARFYSGDHSNAVFETLFAMASVAGSTEVVFDDGSIAVPPSVEYRENMLLIFNELLMRPEICDSIKDFGIVEELMLARSDARYEIAGPADMSLSTLLEKKDERFMYKALTRILQKDAFADWKPDPNAQDFQPHPYSGTFDSLGKLVREKIGHDVGGEWDI